MTSKQRPLIERMERLIAEQNQFNTFLQEGFTQLESHPMIEIQNDQVTPEPVVVDEPAGATVTANEDYEINCLNGLYHWEGLASGPGYEEICSEDGWPTVEQAQADCYYCLSRFDGLEHDEAMKSLRDLNYFSAEVLSACAAENLAQPPLD